jgi:methylmalonyl-CoA mutase
VPAELMRSSEEEKQAQLVTRDALHQRFAQRTPAAVASLQAVARAGGNVFGELMKTVQVASLGQITTALFEVGGQYRRSM